MKNTLQEQKCKKIVIKRHFHLSFFRLYQFMWSSKFVIIEIRAHFKSENPCFLKSVLGSRSENTGTVTRDYVKSSQMKNEIPLQL